MNYIVLRNWIYHRRARSYVSLLLGRSSVTRPTRALNKTSSHAKRDVAAGHAPLEEGRDQRTFATVSATLNV